MTIFEVFFNGILIFTDDSSFTGATENSMCSLSMRVVKRENAVNSMIPRDSRFH